MMIGAGVTMSGAGAMMTGAGATIIGAGTTKGGAGPMYVAGGPKTCQLPGSMTAHPVNTAANGNDNRAEKYRRKRRPCEEQARNASCDDMTFIGAPRVGNAGHCNARNTASAGWATHFGECPGGGWRTVSQAAPVLRDIA